jgi:uncharacterized membrane protein
MQSTSGASSCSRSCRRCRVSRGAALLLGIALGVVAYGAYEFTDLATLRRWPVTMAAVDLIWAAC